MFSTFKPLVNQPWRKTLMGILRTLYNIIFKKVDSQQK